MKRKFLYLALAVGLVMASCSMPGSTSSTNADMLTAAALTVQAALSATPLPAESTPTASSAGITPTQTFSPPMVSVGEVTNCREGPDVNYEKVTQVLPGEQVQITGFYPPNYWLVSTKSGTCWLYGEFATPVGSFAAVPTVTAPPTPTGKPPEALSFAKWNISCDYTNNQATVLLRWNDKAEGETGYRIYRNGTAIAELAPDSTEFTEIISLLSGQSVGYMVEVFSPAGSEQSKTVALSC
jgi:hypothetical protein